MITIVQAFKKLCEGEDIILIGKYWGRDEKRKFTAEEFGYKSRKKHFYHQVGCFKNDFRDISTLHRGNKRHCKFTWKLLIKHKGLI